MNADVDASELAKGMVLNVRIRGARRFVARLWILRGILRGILRLAAFVAPYRVEIEEEAS